MSALSTTSVKPSDVIPFWTDVVCKTYVRVGCEIDNNSRFRAGVRTVDFGRTRLSRVASTPIRYERTTENIADCGNDDYLIKLLTAGQARIEQHGRSTLIGPGDLCLFDTARPYKLVFPDTYQAVMLKIPRAELDARLPVAEDVAAMRVAADGRYTRLAATMLSSSTDLMGDESTSSPRLGANLIDLIALAFDACFNDLQPNDSRYSKIVVRAQDMIMQNLFNPDFDIASVPKGIGVSSRTLNRAFAQQNIAPAKWMWGKRLEASRSLLETGRADSVSDAAMRCGFNDFSHFSRAFKARFGVNASTVFGR
ncbi:hypothetical protein CSC94_11825 [Zhengella mangrovi]|uniref:HTH araC/xylS-type domain-containing protein n=1 Tax=Zhengella mangrovi TaxID=1982044 RepID=A0A2G1QMU1_9HYPH|nr:helix-turn-helix domain-containing protein [Zhengella mangrovi]PHP66789.1 hypothetical protein CSC94_11825 [Zhengella mangrovi]